MGNILISSRKSSRNTFVVRFQVTHFVSPTFTNKITHSVGMFILASSKNEWVEVLLMLVGLQSLQKILKHSLRILARCHNEIAVTSIFKGVNRLPTDYVKLDKP